MEKTAHPKPGSWCHKAHNDFGGSRTVPLVTLFCVHQRQRGWGRLDQRYLSYSGWVLVSSDFIALVSFSSTHLSCFVVTL